jgi:shikimate dehydrogenase
MTVTAATRIAAVIGAPVRHSLSPAIHNAAFAAIGLDWIFVAYEVSDGDATRALDGVRALGIAGLSVTTPHKAAVAAAVDALSPAATALNAVNCVVNRQGQLVGHNTDGEGFVDALRSDAEFDPAGRRCAVLGAGGAARAVIRALALAGAGEVAVVNRTESSAGFAAALAGSVGRVASPDAIAHADLVVNATSIGMGGGPDLPLDPLQLHPGQVVADLVYFPLETALLRAAADRGARPVDGVGMLVHQAAHAFTLWTGAVAPVEVMAAAAREQLARGTQK